MILRAMRALSLTLLVLTPSPASAEEPRPVVAPRPPPIDLDLVGHRWQIMQDSDGRLYHVRKVRTARLAVWAPGLALWLSSYAAGVVGGAYEDGGASLAWLPCAGALVKSIITTDATQILWALDAGAQVAGLVTFIVGLAAGPYKLERRPIVAGPVAFAGGGGGLAVSGRF